MKPQELYRLAICIFLLSGISQLYALKVQDNSLPQTFESSTLSSQRINSDQPNQLYLGNASNCDTEIETIYIEEKEEDDDERESFKKSVEDTQSIIFLFYTYPQNFLLESFSRFQLFAKQLHYSFSNLRHIALRVFRI